jgi:ribonuclease-3
MRSKIVSREHLNDRKRLKFSSIHRKQSTLNHFGENIHGNIFESLVGFIWIEVMYIVKNLFKKEW